MTRAANIFRWLRQRLCCHLYMAAWPHERDGLLYVMCLHCGHESLCGPAR